MPVSYQNYGDHYNSLHYRAAVTILYTSMVPETYRPSRVDILNATYTGLTWIYYNQTKNSYNVNNVQLPLSILSEPSLLVIVDNCQVNHMKPRGAI